MNLGMRDAIFLGEAIAVDLASNDPSQPALTKWAEERRAAGKRVVQLAGNLTEVGLAKDPGYIMGKARDWVIWIVGLFPFVPRMMVWGMSGLQERPKKA